jgi:hypothetical protein
MMATMTIRSRPDDGDVASDRLRPEVAQITGFQTRKELIEYAVWLMELRGHGRFAELAANMTDDCEIVVPGTPGMSPFIGTFRGRDACIAAIKAHFTMIEFVGLTHLSTFADGDTVVINWKCSMRNRGSGPMLPVEGMARVQVRDRKTCFYSNHMDTAAIAALADFPPLRP